MTYAADTSVSVERSRAELERTLTRYGATSFAYGWEGSYAHVAFAMADRRVRFLLPLPDRRSKEFTHTPGRGTPRAPKAAEEAWQQACRQRWRALNLVVKAKLEAVEAGISTFEDEFLAHIILPNGETFGTWAAPRLAAAYETGKMPALLPGSPT